MTSARNTLRLPAAVAAGALLAGLGWYLAGEGAVEDEAPRPAPRAGASTPDVSRSRPAPLLARVAPAVVTGGDLPVAVEETEAQDPGDEGELKEPPTLSEEDRQDRDLEHQWISKRFKADPHDVAWTDETRAHVLGLLESGGFETSALQEVECREAVCRIALEAHGGARALELVRLGRRVHEENWVDSKKDGGDRWRVEFFFARRGQSLSRLVYFPDMI